MNKNEMLNKLNEVLQEKGAHIISFEYYKKAFGNMVLIIDYQNENHVFVVDRREIYYNDKFLFEFHLEGNDYYQKMKESPNLHFLLKAIEKTLY
ncbi:MAG: hypothetical protein EP317_03855 [Bacillota bacterium]|nr:MAG: hypothetical protein EP317_03855 [Bacillota bacterium]